MAFHVIETDCGPCYPKYMVDQAINRLELDIRRQKCKRCELMAKSCNDMAQMYYEWAIEYPGGFERYTAKSHRYDRWAAVWSGLAMRFRQPIEPCETLQDVLEREG